MDYEERFGEGDLEQFQKIASGMQIKSSRNIKRLLLRCIHHFKSVSIFNINHMRISGTQLSSVILSQTMCF